MNDFPARLTALLDTLPPAIEIELRHIGEPELERWCREEIANHGISVSEKLIEFYCSMSDCSIEWSCDLKKHGLKLYDPGDELISGKIHIRPIEAMLQLDPKLTASLWTSKLDDGEEEDLQRFRNFDFNEDYLRTGFLINSRNELSEQLYFLQHESSGLCPVDLSFAEYLDKMLEYQGFMGWQYNHLFQMTGNYRRMMFYLEQLGHDALH